MQGNEFNRILEDIQNAATSKRKDKFAKKYALLVCNEIYRTKAGLDNLPKVKNDLKDIRRTTKMLSIEDDNTFLLVDTTHDEMESTYEIIKDRMVAQVCELRKLTGIGSNFKNRPGGLLWKNLLPVVNRLIDYGLIKIVERKLDGNRSVESVDLSDLN